jgi:hypothetical protein
VATSTTKNDPLNDYDDNNNNNGSKDDVRLIGTNHNYLSLHDKHHCPATDKQAKQTKQSKAKQIYKMLQYDDSAFYFFSISVLSFFLFPCKN